MASVCERVPPPSTKPTKSYSLTPRRSDKDEMQRGQGEGEGDETGVTHTSLLVVDMVKSDYHTYHTMSEAGAGADSELARCH